MSIHTYNIWTYIYCTSMYIYIYNIYDICCFQSSESKQLQDQNWQKFPLSSFRFPPVLQMLMLTCQMHGSGLHEFTPLIHWICRFPFSLSRAQTPSASLHLGVLLLHGPPTTSRRKRFQPAYFTYLTYLTLNRLYFLWPNQYKPERSRKAKHCIVNTELQEIRCHAWQTIWNSSEYRRSFSASANKQDGPRLGGTNPPQRLGRRRFQLLQLPAPSSTSPGLHFTTTLETRRHLVAWNLKVISAMQRDHSSTYWASKEMHFKLCCAWQTAPRHVSWRLPACSEKIQEMSNNLITRHASQQVLNGIISLFSTLLWVKRRAKVPKVQRHSKDSPDYKPVEGTKK